MRHEAYNQINKQNDIALIFASPVPRTEEERVRAACLPDPRLNYTGWELSLVTGWGDTRHHGDPRPGPALSVQVVPVSDWECEAVMRARPGMMCAGGEAGKDACQGDSGGPLVVSSEGATWSVVGLVSWGVGCGQEGRYGVYTRVSHFTPWISQHISQPASCQPGLWCDFLSGRDPTILIILCLILSLVLLIIIYFCQRKSGSRTELYRVTDEEDHCVSRVELDTR